MRINLYFLGLWTLLWGGLLFSPARNIRAQDVAQGETLYRENCLSCHGDQGQGMESQKAPRLRGQHAWYLLSSLEQFQRGERANSQMAPFIKDLSAQDFQNLAAYLGRPQ